MRAKRPTLVITFPTTTAALSWERHCMEKNIPGRLIPVPVTITAEECDGLDLCDGEPTRTPGERLAASYVNFYIANEAVVMPAFGDPMDEKAQAILQELFPTRKVVAIPARDILIGGGNIHCVTQQIPKI